MFVEWQPHQLTERQDDWEVVGIQKNNQGEKVLFLLIDLNKQSLQA